MKHLCLPELGFLIVGLLATSVACLRLPLKHDRVQDVYTLEAYPLVELGSDAMPLWLLFNFLNQSTNSAKLALSESVTWIRRTCQAAGT